MSGWHGARALVTGGTGTIGSAVVRRLLRDEAEVVRVFSRDDTKQFELERRLEGDRRVRFLIGDVRDRERLIRAAESMDLIVHSAALKHVAAAEYNPFEAVETNVRGTQNVIDAAVAHNVTRVVLVSTDKAAEPHSVMGATKLLAERLFYAAHHFRGSHEQVTFSAVRFGNVLWSRGSIVPALLTDMRAGRPLTLTDPTMTRFVISVDDSIDLIVRASESASGGETYVAKMRAATVLDLATALLEEFADLAPRKPEIRIVGKRAGERDHDLLMSEEEAKYARDAGTMWVVSDVPVKSGNAGPYSSRNAPRYRIEELRELLRRTTPLAPDLSI